MKKSSLLCVYFIEVLKLCKQPTIKGESTEGRGYLCESNRNSENACLTRRAASFIYVIRQFDLRCVCASV